MEYPAQAVKVLLMLLLLVQAGDVPGVKERRVEKSP